MRPLPRWAVVLALFLAAMILPWIISRLISAFAEGRINFDRPYAYPIDDMTRWAGTRIWFNSSGRYECTSSSALTPSPNSLHVRINVDTAAFRRGPSSDYELVCVGQRDERFAVVAQSTGDDKWYLIQVNAVDAAWVSADSVELSANEAVIPVATAIPTGG